MIRKSDVCKVRCFHISSGFCWSWGVDLRSLGAIVMSWLTLKGQLPDIKQLEASLQEMKKSTEEGEE